MGTILLNASLVIGAFLLMELVAWFTHKYVLHGFLWVIHKSHHQRHSSGFEQNDLFFLFYGSLATIFFILGSAQLDWRFWVATGITCYGLAYFLIHDLFIHRRLKLFPKTRNRYLKALDMAHKRHHKSTARLGGESFGMLWVPWQYVRSSWGKHKYKQTLPTPFTNNPHT